MDPKNRALDGRANWRHLANTVQRLCTAVMSGTATRVGDAACSQITSGNVVNVVIPALRHMSYITSYALQQCSWFGCVAQW